MANLSATSGTFTPPDEPVTPLYIGHHESSRSEIVTPNLLARAQVAGYDMLTAPITTSHFHARVLSLLQEHLNHLSNDRNARNVPMPLISPLGPEDTALTPEEANSALIGVISPWIDLASPDPLISHASRAVFGLELAYAAFCGINNVMIHGPIRDDGILQYGRALLEGLGMGPYLQLHVLLPMTGDLEEEGSSSATHLSELARGKYSSFPGDEASEQDDELPELYGSWQTWEAIRTMCNYHTRLSIDKRLHALELPRQLPSLNLQSRWYSEHIRLLMFPRTSFLRNAKGYPVLSKAHQQYLTRFLRLRFPPWALLSDCGAIPSPSGGTKTSKTVSEPTPAEAAAAPIKTEEKPTVHLEYLRHLQQTQPYRPPMERFGQGYQDYLQSPLQPLTDNLESITYEVFEKDPVKYEWYERAIALALKDLRQLLGDGAMITVAVVGAGRGPLVSRALQASQKAGIPIRCCAVEKNPNAYVLLQRRNATDPLWNRQVSVVKTDMRSWPGPVGPSGEAGKVDILVSELLGSFADNELSPECLDGVQHVLHPDHGINIPQSYSAHFTPLASPRIYGDLLSKASTDLNMTVQSKWELPYVVMLHQFDYLSTQPTSAEQQHEPEVKEAWSFSHPVPHAVLEQAKTRAGGTTSAGPGGFTGGDGSNEHNVRSCVVTFPIASAGTCHGLAGYFETVLYSSPSTNQIVELSTNPVTMADKSKDMISWFPIFFPLKTPMSLPEGSEMDVRMWRMTDDRAVWYEWVVEVFERAGGTGRRGGARKRLGMSELHSSRKHGCLM